MNPQEAVPRKRMKVGITRVRTGCYTCRRRKVKCDEAKPECQACVQLALRCEGYAPRFTFCYPQTFGAIQWATPAVPESDSPRAQPSLSPEVLMASDQSLYSAYSGSVAGSDKARESPSSVTDSLEHRESSTVESSTGGSGIQFDGNSHGRFSPFNDAFLDTTGDSEFTSSFDSNFLGTRLSHDRIDLSSDSTASPSEGADVYHVRATPCSILANSNDQLYKSSPLTQRYNNPLSELYFEQWHNSVASLLPPVFRDITTEMPEFSPLRNAVLAISAAHLAHLESMIVRTTNRTRKSRYIPHKYHQYHSLEYYDEGIQEIGRWLETLPQVNPLYVIAALLLFYYFELDSGSFTGGIGHMNVIEKFLSSNHEEVKSSPTGRKLLCTWMNLRSLFVNRYLGGYRSSKSAYSIDTFPLNHVIAGGGWYYDSITIMMCDCKLISRRIILDWCVARGEYRNTVSKTQIDNLLTQMSLPKSRQESVSQLAIVDESYVKALEKQRARLDKWHSSLDLSELPIDSYLSQRHDLSKRSTTELEILPLVFHTFDAAMNYAYYAHTQMLCSQDIITRLESPTFVEPPFTRKDCPWAELILRITSGLHVADCMYKNTFNTGILPILTACMAFCPRADVASWIEDWIRKVEDFGVPLESGLPFGITKRILRFILRQRRNERDVLLILPLDTEDAEKSDLYQSDFKMQVVVCGKDMHTGKLYHETVEIPEV